jgi:hypothetical protein
MTKVEKMKVIVFVSFMTAMVTLAVYNSVVYGTECVFCTR